MIGVTSAAILDDGRTLAVEYDTEPDVIKEKQKEITEEVKKAVSYTHLVTNKTGGMVLPALMVGVLLLSVFTSLLKSSESGPGSMHAPLILSLIGGLIFGAFAQKSRMCFAGGIRDVILMKNFDLLTVIIGLFAVMLVYNLVSGNFVLGFNTPGAVSYTHLRCMRNVIWFRR